MRLLSMALSLIERRKISTRVYGCVAFILSLLAIVAIISLHGLGTTARDFEQFSEINHSMTEVAAIDRQVSELRRSTLAFLLGDPVIDSIKALVGDIRTRLSRTETNTEKTTRADGFSELSQGVESLVENIETVTRLRLKKENIFLSQIPIQIKTIRRAVGKLNNLAMDAGDLEKVWNCMVVDAAVADALAVFGRLAMLDDSTVAEGTTAAVENLRSSLADLAANLTDAEARALAEDAANAAQALDEAVHEGIAAKKELADLIHGSMNRVSDAIATLASTSVDKKMAEMAVVGDRLRDAIETTWQSALSVAVIAGVIGVTLAFIIARGIVRPVSAMTLSMQRLAHGDTTADIPATGNRDEIGDMARAVQVFKDNMLRVDRLAAERQADQAARGRRSQRIEGLTSSFETSVAGTLEIMAGKSGMMENTAQAMSANAEQTRRLTSLVGVATREAQANIQTVVAAAEQLAASTRSIGQQVEQSLRVTRTASSEATRTNDTVTALAGAASRIGEVVNLINDIARQTNLLALNATIEAARAGEAGKGFAVVAGEVKGLATQTARATGDIGAQIGSVQATIRDVVQAIDGIVQRNTEIAGIASVIASAVDEQTAATHEIAQSIQQAAGGIQGIMGNIVSVNQSADTTGAAARDVLSAAEQLGGQARMLTAEVAAFLDAVRSA